MARRGAGMLAGEVNEQMENGAVVPLSGAAGRSEEIPAARGEEFARRVCQKML